MPDEEEISTPERVRNNLPPKYLFGAFIIAILIYLGHNRGWVSTQFMWGSIILMVGGLIYLYSGTPKDVTKTGVIPLPEQQKRLLAQLHEWQVDMHHAELPQGIIKLDLSHINRCKIFKKGESIHTNDYFGFIIDAVSGAYLWRFAKMDPYYGGKGILKISKNITEFPTEPYDTEIFIPYEERLSRELEKPGVFRNASESFMRKFRRDIQ